MLVHQQKGLSLVNGNVRQRQRRRPFINVDTRFINDPLRGFLSILQVFEYRLPRGGRSKWLFNCSWKGFVMIYCMEREIICLFNNWIFTNESILQRNEGNINWNILRVFFFFLSTRRYFWTDDPLYCFFFS